MSEIPNGRTTGRVCLTIEGSVAVMTLDRPPVNALSSHMYAQLGRAAAQITGDPGIKVAILTGSGQRFSGGADVKELASHTPAERQDFWALTSETRRLFLGIPVPVIAAIDGPAVGAGVAYVTHCDYRIAASGTFLSMPEIDVGSVAGGGEALLAIGMPSGAVRYLLYSGNRIPAEEALRVHLVDELAPAGAALALARERAAVIAEKPRAALVAMKRAINVASAATPGEDVLARTQQITLDMMRGGGPDGL
jgi:enoyl-CoA hydratase/carnithine racemase